MIPGHELVAELTQAGVSHVVWIPDSHLGTWDTALRDAANLQLIRACREGEALALAGGLILGGKRPVVMIQCTGFFEAGDALRNLVHDLKLPLFLLVGVRSWIQKQKQGNGDTCPVYIEPIVKAWNVPYVWLKENAAAADVARAYMEAQKAEQACIALLPE